ncbi:dTDP-4-amino-4,6-dideoxygalactose transaminase [Salinisphaera sp. S4-8]|uniref:dTDP-4-amino-4,6-dideoxygalactose transaminase n=1 Tax=Salinisphaera sp. S4-8 TaxID=633357 RepID=UPI00333F211B
MDTIPFNRPPQVGNEVFYIRRALKGHLAGDGPHSKLCENWFEERLRCYRALLTPSCTHALELAALLIDVRPGDEVIMPSYTFVSTANAFALRGATIVFVDVRADTMNIDEGLIEAAVTEATVAIVPVHYAGVSCEMDAVMSIADRYGLFVIEDAAQGMMSRYKGRFLGSIAHLAAYSFHETKNYTSGGEGGLLIVNDEQFSQRAEIFREKGTNRSQFFRGAVDKYSWVDIGSSYLPSELQAAYLWGQLQYVEKIKTDRLRAWQFYSEQLQPLAAAGKIELPKIPAVCEHNGHMFYVKVENLDERSRLIAYLKNEGIGAAFHYVPLHSSSAGLRFGRLSGEDVHTTSESERLVRLPLWFGISFSDLRKVTDAVFKFYQ